MLISPEAKLSRYYRWTVVGRGRVIIHRTVKPGRVLIGPTSNSRERISSRERIMYRFAAALFAGIIATALVTGTAFTPTPAEAAKMSKEDTVALKEATVACKAEAKDKKIRWPASRRFINNCVTRALKDRPTFAMQLALKEANVACKAEAKGRKGSWLARREYVKNCIITTTLKDRPSMDVNQLRRTLDVNGFRMHQPSEWGCPSFC